MGDQPDRALKEIWPVAYQSQASEKENNRYARR